MRSWSSRIVVLLAQWSLCHGLEKSWLPDLEWDTAGNWLEGRAPVTDSRVVFPLETRHAVGMPESGSLTVSEIDLARSGSVSLFRNGKLQVSGARGTGTRTWKREGHLFWADPDNWSSSSKAVPHLERVPCRQDNVVLPGLRRTFSAVLPITETEVRSVRVADRPLVSEEWNDFGNRREFGRGRFTVKYSEQSCEGCGCQNDPRGDYLEEVCSIQRPRCGSSTCEYPLTVEGHCCRYCGGRVLIGGKVSILAVQALVEDTLVSGRVDWYVRRTSSGTVEVLIQERGDYSGVDVLEAVDNVKSALEGSGTEVLSTETAGRALTDSRLAIVMAPLLGPPLVIIPLLVLGFVYFGYSFGHIVSGCRDMYTSVRYGIHKEKPGTLKPRPFSFARFENVPDGSVRIADASVSGERNLNKVDDEEAEVEAPAGGRFENPLYRSKRKKEDKKMDALDMAATLSLSTLKGNSAEDEPIEEVELDIDQ